MEDPARESLETGLLSEPVTDKKIELARSLFANLETQVMIADRKVQAVFGLNAFLVAAISLQSQQSFNAIAHTGFTLNVIIDLLLKGTFLICICIATWSGVKAMNPRLRINKQTKKSLFFFGDIRSQSFNEFSSAFLSLDNEEALKQLLSSAYTVSNILTLKYKMLRRSTFSISLAILIWVLIQVNKFAA